MSRITAILAEDEAPQRAELRALLTELWPELDVVAECADGVAAINALHQSQPDVAFLDIRMPGASGLEVARGAGRAQVVFITAYDSYAVKAFEEGAADYLLKPISRERLKIAVARLQGRLAKAEPVDLSAVLARLEARLDARPEPLRWITANVGAAVRMIPIEDVLFFQSQDKYTRVATPDAEAHIRLPLKDLVERLDPDAFWQVHRSCVVRVAAIRLVKRDEDGRLQLHLAGTGETLPVSSAYAARFRGL